MWRPFVALIVQGLLLVDGATANAVVSTPGAAAGAIVVTTPSQLQEAVRSGQRHVIINDHLDLTKSPKFSETTALDTSVLAVVQTGSGHFTQSIQVRPLQRCRRSRQRQSFHVALDRISIARLIR